MSTEPNTELAPALKRHLHDRLGKNTKVLLWSGIGLVVIGFLAIVFPVVTSFTVVLFVGWFFLIGGAMSIFGAFSYHGTGSFFGALLLGLLNFALGIILISNPGIGVLTLTLVLVVMFMLEGAYQAALAFELRPAAGWGWVLLSALVSIAASVLIAAGLPGTSTFVVGLLVGLNFMSAGFALIMLSRLFGDAGKVA